jgi:hypothetical protein
MICYNKSFQDPQFGDTNVIPMGVRSVILTKCSKPDCGVGLSFSCITFMQNVAKIGQAQKFKWGDTNTIL